MKLDYVHDLQQCFRRIVTAMSFPGQIVDLSAYADRADLEINMYRASLLVALLILDSEVTFAVLPDSDRVVSRTLAQVTYSREAALNEASYLFIAGDSAAILEGLASARTGTLTDPHHGATVVVEAASLSEGLPFELTGPGIVEQRTVAIQLGDNDCAWHTTRNDRNVEYPMGIDLILVDAHNRLMALPRTTQLVMAGG